ncbi:MAG TPA: hypothetical protein VGC86_13710 [Afipia sp.]
MYQIVNKPLVSRWSAPPQDIYPAVDVTPVQQEGWGLDGFAEPSGITPSDMPPMMEALVGELGDMTSHDVTPLIKAMV